MVNTGAQPERIGKYEILGALGRGSMGVVYKGLDPEIGRTVAIKTLRKVSMQGTGPNNALERFKIEARSAGNLRHPNIITVFDVNVEAETPYIVMDYVEGRSLHSILKKQGRLSVEEALEYLYQIAEGLDAAHKSHIIHRDIKPSNLMVDAQNRVYILDFGVARINQEMSQAQGSEFSEPVMGTPGYMSPEQILNEPLDARSDLFALAIVAFEMLSGKRPFGGSNFTEIVSNILNSKPESLTHLVPDLPLALEVEFEKALSRDREHRFNSALQMVKAFQVSAGIQSQALTAPRTGVIGRMRKASEWKSISSGLDVGVQPSSAASARPLNSSTSVLPQAVPEWAKNKSSKPAAHTAAEYAEREHVGAGMFGSQQSLSAHGSFEGKTGSPLVRSLTVLVGVICVVFGFAIFWLLNKEPDMTETAPDLGTQVIQNAEQPIIPSLDTLGNLRTINPVEIPTGLTVREMNDEQVLAVLLRSDLTEAVMLDALRESKARGLPDLVDACINPLKHDSYLVRLETLKLLGELRDRRIIPIMLESLDDHDPLVRTQASKSLALLGSRSAISYLRTRYLKEEVPQVKQAIKQAIEQINGFPMPE